MIELGWSDDGKIHALGKKLAQQTRGSFITATLPGRMRKSGAYVLINKKLVLAYGCLFLAPLFWSGNYIMGRMMHGHIPPVGLAFYRWLFVIFFLTPFLFRKIPEYWRHIRDLFWRLVILSVLSIVTYTALVYIGLNYTTVVNGSLLNALVPVLIVMLSHFILGERLSARKAVGLLFSLFGAAILILHGELSSLSKFDFNKGGMFILMAAAAWALFSVLLKKTPKVLPPLVFLYVTAIMGCIILIPFKIMESMLVRSVSFDMSTFVSILYAAIVPSILAFTFWNIGIHKVGPAKAGYFFNLLPVYSGILAVLFLGEHFHRYEAVGTLLVFLGILFATVNIGIFRKKMIHEKP